jgi:hypothetical protein
VVTVITPGKVVRVGPDELDADDILEFGQALIEEQGWVKGESGDATKGWSIHGAVGEAARRAMGQTSKSDYGPGRDLRNEAAAQLAAANDGRTEADLNDTADTVDQVLALMGAAKGVVV